MRQLVRRVEPLRPTDSVGRAVEIVRRSSGGVAPVIEENGAVVGVVREADLLRVLPLSAPQALDDPVEGARVSPVKSLMSREVLLLPDWYSVQQTARLMDTRSLAAMPVVDGVGAYVGMVSRRDLLESLGRTFRPVSVGGMATPLGVYLTTGHHRAGAGDLGLFLTGATLFLLTCVGHWVVFAGIWCVDELLGLHWSEVYLSPFLAASRGMPAVGWMFDLVTVVVFFLLFRAVPVTGYHAAEHQVVHTIERGGRLERDVVRAMPRPHPRCGTNLVAFLMVFMFLANQFSAVMAGPAAAFLAMAVTLPVWRVLGRQLQQYVTTKPATDRQLDNGMQVGRDILRRHHGDPARRVSLWRRIWHAGILQVIAGGLTVWGVGRLLARHVDLSWFL